MMMALQDKKNVTLMVNGREMQTIECKCFTVSHMTINYSLFQQVRDDYEQEKTRRTIVRAFEEVKNNPSKYTKPFTIIIPKKTWSEKTVWELQELAQDIGDHVADWIEQALEWAQRITNGETWKSICNMPDDAKWYRLVIWKNGYVRIVGGSTEHNNPNPASDVGCDDCNMGDVLANSVPCVVSYN